MSIELPHALAFVDLETTGATTTHDRITEIGIVLIDGDQVSEWSSLVNPGTSIPPFIQSLTGITDAMVADAPRFSELADAVAGQLSGRVFVAHNARFDYGFLRSEFERVGIEFRAPVICTVKLSRKLFPQQHKHNLDSLISRHGLATEQRHRALADAQVIARFWQLLRRDHDPDALATAVAVQIAKPSLPPHIDPMLIEQLPEGHGVYLLYGENDLPLYVGKSKTVRRRVLSHFAADLTSAKEMSLAQQVRRIEAIPTAGEIGALLREAMLVKKLQPTHNRLLRKNTGLCSWSLAGGMDGSQPPRLIRVDDPEFGAQDDQFGLFKTVREAHKTLRDLADANGLCHVLLGLEKLPPGRPCFAHQLHKCRGACVGKESRLQHAARLAAALSALRVASWPYAGPALLREGDEVHVIDQWAYVGTARSDETLYDLLEAPRPAFDRDTYLILQRVRQRLQPMSVAS
jgi:DNA polymerase-3 subunit epsilon